MADAHARCAEVERSAGKDTCVPESNWGSHRRGYFHRFGGTGQRADDICLIQIVCARKPPSTRRSEPVTKLLAFWLARKMAAPTSSLGPPKRAIGVCDQIAF